MTDATADEVAVRCLIDAWTRAIHARDVKGVTDCEAPDLAAFALAPPLVVTGSDGEGLRAWFDTWAGPIGYDLHDPGIAASGDVAFVHGLAHMTGTKSDGEVVDLWFRCTVGLRKRGGAWKIAHLHESVPFLMDGSFKAAVDLKP